jgi:DEAD/DEAH box helicase domain-containing protein
MLASDAQSRALYLFPLKALAQDQLSTFRQWAEAANALKAEAAIYDGDTSAYQRKRIRQHPPNLLITNPEMVHLALLPFHDRWGAFFSRLRVVVVDEVHTYRGMFGAHMAQLLRRLQRVCAHYGASPTFVFTSATVANPGELAGRLIGQPVEIIQESGAPQAARHIVLIDPANGASQAAIELLKAALARRLRTIVYTQSRKAAELITLWSQQRSGRWADRISVYRAGLMPENRRDIERRLKSGRLLAVVSTSALELGIDIGDLDICILVGYPGSMISTWQRSGRVGRRGQEAALILIAGEDALDKYYIAHPHAFWQIGRASCRERVS